jgi:hypothetical protein
MPMSKGRFRWEAICRLLMVGLCALGLLFARQVQASGTVTNCTEADFLEQFFDGGTVTFTGACAITLTAPVGIIYDTTIDAGTNVVTINGGGSVRLFEVAPNVTLTLMGLVLNNGSHPTNGAALYIHPGATVTITNCTISGNRVTGTNGVVGVNGADNSGNGKTGTGGSAGDSVVGGAIYNLGDLRMLQCFVVSNTVTGGNGGNGGNGGTGGFQGGNGGPGGNGGTASGGAVYNLGSLLVRDSTFFANFAFGGNGGLGGTNGTGGTGPGIAGYGGAGAAASGGGISSTQNVTVLSSTFSDNQAIGGTSATAGMRDNGNGYDGTRGGDARGGGIFGLGTGALTNNTFFNNRAAGGTGGNGGPARWTAGDGGDGGTGTGGGLYNTGSFVVVNCTFTRGNAVGGTNGAAGAGSFAGSPGNPGLAQGGNIAGGGGTLTLKNTIIGTNLSGGGGYRATIATIVDAGNNISADASFALGGTSFTNTDPKLGTLTTNGGPTLTVAPLIGSPAIDKGDNTGAPAVDQRRVNRPIGAQVDIGAIEVGIVITAQPQSLTRNSGESATFTVSATGDPPLRYRWRFQGTNLASATTSSFTRSGITAAHAGGYTVVISNHFGMVTSAVATLTVTPAPGILIQPTNQTVTLGQSATFAVGAGGAAPLSYQWRFNNTAISGATTNTFTRPSVQPGHAGSYAVVITNASGSITSQPAVLTVFSPPALTQVSGTTTNVSFSYQTSTGRTYVIEYKNDLDAPSWTPLATNAGSGSVLTYVDAYTNLMSRFYRVVVR